jgi:hypothetical protein
MLFDYIQPKIADYFTTKNESQSYRVSSNKNKTLATEIKMDNSNISEIDFIDERNVQSTGD